MKGILLMSFGKTDYGKWAFNMAHSIRHYSKLPIHLICDVSSTSGIDLSIFDSHNTIEFDQNENGKIDPCLAKIKLFERSPFKETLYLDVDGVLINNPEDIFKRLENKYLFVQPMGKGGKNDSINYTWAENEVVYKHFNLSNETIFQTCQTSIVYFKKNEETKKFFNQLKFNYDNKLDGKYYREMWGKSSQHPDELYYSVTMAQCGIELEDFKPIFFPEKTETIKTILENYYVLSMYGGNNVKPYGFNLYDKIMQNILGSNGLNHYYKAQRLYKNKFINQK